MTPSNSIPHWLETLLNAAEITDICINCGTHPEAGVFIDQGQGMQPYSFTQEWKEWDAKSWVLGTLARAGKSWDARFPFADAVTTSGHRMHVTFPPISPHGLLISLRKLPTASNKQTRHRWSQSPLYAQLSQAIKNGDSILIAGATGSGKTTLACDLLSEINASERIIALEDTPELMPSHPHFISLQSRPANADGCGEVALSQLLKQTLRMRPDRIILGECRGAEVLDLLQALNTGHKGALATIHANSAREAVKRIELLCLLAAHGNIPLGVIRDLIALGIQWLVQVRRVGSERQIQEVYRIEGKEGDTLLLRPILCPAPFTVPRTAPETFTFDSALAFPRP